jgi:hypothetical protein
MAPKSKKQLSRRDALKVLGAATGASMLANLPEKWSSPELLSGVLPAHAQTSACGDYMQAIAVTTTQVEGQDGLEYGDFDFMLCTPNGYWVWNGSSGDGATSSPDNINFDPVADNETLDITNAVPGTYTIYLLNASFVDLEMSIQITTATGVYTINFTLTVEQSRAVADVTFPCGEVTWREEEMFPPCINGAADSIDSKSYSKYKDK